MSGDMLWGYFFTDTDPEKLARAGHLLAERGYRCVGVRPPEDDPGGLHWLHVERIETHSVDSLQTRNVSSTISPTNSICTHMTAWTSARCHSDAA
jgi:hypothetical protein